MTKLFDIHNCENDFFCLPVELTIKFIKKYKKYFSIIVSKTGCGNFILAASIISQINMINYLKYFTKNGYSEIRREVAKKIDKKYLHKMRSDISFIVRIEVERRFRIVYLDDYSIYV